MEVLLVRHGQSEGNLKKGDINKVDPQQNGDHKLNLTPIGITQAENEGREIGPDFIRDALIYSSPYKRTRQTLDGIIEGAGAEKNKLIIYEDPRLREVEHGFHGTSEDVAKQESLRKTHGKFYYRFKGGESPADCYDRVATFLESLQRQVQRKGRDKILIVSHGLTIRCFIMRFLHLTVEQFGKIKNPSNCDCVRIALVHNMENENIVFKNRKWGVSGTKLLSE